MKFGIIGAMDVEVQLLLEAMKANGPLLQANHGGMAFSEGVLGAHQCVVVQSGVGMVNAALCTQVLVDRFGVDQVINTGVAGSLDPRLDICDILVAESAVNHLMNACNFGYAPGQVPGMDQVAFPTNPLLASQALERARKLGLHAVAGVVASGDEFVRTAEEKRRIRNVFGAACCEMEGAAIAQACWVNDVPCVIVRAISDKADGSDAMDYPEFEQKAARTCAQLVEELVRSCS
ncbi:5'-methylthioadenosine/adenosylhomocysteine nucleosidase [Parvibacter caecicola]|uniref:adenosylhomocysteine nucleosidase n=1 Tax=Parvibacter caecicola TaxID=747645 RepID=A0A7W5D297_9ACTN|nr:5'-methylthioadenosine/adenosylhomocysteine nucleosidase [Parvibacter caecicola]MBB3171358.1 adenosylhomocysteine nucleosidase [Parvibacter caecicola]MCR2041235.1 5'-methylthioadenosine/adenosylhomocysteine nucleosidase [Parvibacter caecicola]RNL11581.1 5'-methylthioadenosine/adenosylhomocysteine nucleosidase [Parvibacter caecicola]